MAFSKLRQRLITAAILVAALLAILIASDYSCAGKQTLFYLALISTLICAGEFARFASFSSSGESRRTKIPPYFLVCALPILSVGAHGVFSGICGAYYLPSDALHVLVPSFALAMAAAVGVMTVGARNNLKDAGAIAGDLFLACFHIGFGGAALVFLALLPGAAAAITWMFLTVALNDTAAYFAGSQFQGPKLAPTISPNKTVSGSIGGLVVGTLVGTLAGTPLGYHGSIKGLILLSLLITLAGQLGDLAKSYLKRLHGVKDSSNLLPGHGGLYDRIDAVLFAAPLVVVWFF